MSVNEDTSQAPQPTKFGAIGLLTNNPLSTDSNASHQPEPVPNEITTNNDGLINDLQSQSITPDDNNIRRKSIASGRFIDDQESSSTPAIIDSSTDKTNQGPIRSMSESALIDTTEQPSTLPIQKDESSTDGDDFFGAQTTPTNNESTGKLRQDSPSQEQENKTNSPLNGDLLNSKTRTTDDNQRPLSATKQNSFDETTRSGTTSPKPSTSQTQSPITSGDEKRAQLPDETGTDTDRDNQEVAAISRRPSRAKSPLNRPRSPTPDDSRKTPTDLSKLIKPGEQLTIPTDDINNERVNSPPPSPSGVKRMVLTDPVLESNLGKTDQDRSRPSSDKNRQSPASSSVSNEKIIDGDIIPSKSRRSSNISQQRTTITDQKSNLPSGRKGNSGNEKKLTSRQNSSEQNKKDSRRSSTDTDTLLKQKQERALSNDKRKSPLQKRSGQQSRKNSTKTTDQTVVTPITTDSKKSEKRLSTTDSDNERSKLPPVNSIEDNQTSDRTRQAPIPPVRTTDDDIPSFRPQSPTAEQVASHNQTPKTNIKKKEQHRPIRRSNSAESFNQIPLVDDKSLDSASGNNTETEQQKKRRVKSKKKDVETNTDSKINTNESTPKKSSKSTKPISNQPDSNTNTIRRSVKQSKDSSDDQDPVNVNVTVFVKNIPANPDNDNSAQRLNKSTKDFDRHTESDTEQIITEKQKKRRRPKRISRTTQTYERYFRHMDDEQPEELRPTNDRDKSIQTRKSQLRPKPKSPRKLYPVYLSADAFKVEEISPKQYSQAQRNQSKTSVIPRSISPQNGKLLILRPTLPFHHTDAVKVQRINLQYAIDLIPNENKSSTPKLSEEINHFPMIRSPSNLTSFPIHKTNIKDKPTSNKPEDRTHQRKNGGAV